MRQPDPSLMNQRGFTLLHWIGLLAVTIAVGGGAYWWFMEKATDPRSPTEITEGTIDTPRTIPASKEEKPAHMKSVMVDTHKQQLIGVRTEPAIIRDMTHMIRTVGQVAVDERRLVHHAHKIRRMGAGTVCQIYGGKSSERPKTV